jgi:hypothetical protein
MIALVSFRAGSTAGNCDGGYAQDDPLAEVVLFALRIVQSWNSIGMKTCSHAPIRKQANN